MGVGVRGGLGSAVQGSLGGALRSDASLSVEVVQGRSMGGWGAAVAHGSGNGGGSAAVRGEVGGSSSGVLDAIGAFDSAVVGELGKLLIHVASHGRALGVWLGRDTVLLGRLCVIVGSIGGGRLVALHDDVEV